MATGPQHYRLAEDAIKNAQASADHPQDERIHLQYAEAHALLAVAAATALGGDLSGPNAAEWAAVAAAPAEAADARRRTAARR